jgi:hypothetical protein
MEFAQPLPLFGQLAVEDGLQALRLVVVGHGLGLLVGRNIVDALAGLAVERGYFCFLKK